MVALKPRFVTDTSGKPTDVLLSLQEYEAILEHLEELEDIAAYDAAKAEGGEAVPWEQVKEEMRRLGKEGAD